MRTRVAVVAAVVVVAAIASPPSMAPARARAEAPAPAVAAAASPSPDRVPLRLALQTEGAAGVATGRFYNHMAGVRLDGQFSPRLGLGAYLGYVNLKGKDGRAHDLLPYAQLEYRAGPLAGPVCFPLRFASGYLPRNGPLVRVAGGMAFALGARAELVVEVVAPIVWVTRDQMLLSLGAALELGFRL